MENKSCIISIKCSQCGHSRVDIIDHRQHLDCPECGSKDSMDDCGPAKPTTLVQADRFNTGKPQWSQVDFESLIPMVQVLEYGAKKYGKRNWKKGLPVSECIESLLRHTFSLLSGEECDEESTLRHIGHMQANCMFIAYNLKNKPEFNDIIKV